MEKAFPWNVKRAFSGKLLPISFSFFEGRLLASYRVSIGGCER
jgi:hypothetical protein